MDNKTALNIARGLMNWLAVETGDKKTYLRAGNALMWERSGRKPKHPQSDDRAIRDAQDLLASGGATSLWNALVLVSRSRWPYKNERSSAERLRRRIKRTLAEKK